ncbi:antibiotic biosynthesis monooxygenase [Mucilaginibacter sp. Bleaf8]|uniref:putative quinol monooxygenase n=1 Tax=Mucilaginibacter sp. Bleaf8 TaxID=2834430 RepID=UPI001BCEF642|nr:putative quinol monooxygenase [Mucilaginibacter sp. Bleaf8]MBS7562827.1 antibiotic biosynthesis monooxygenase [Mucilaginibacter sp. Bleaf8]
MIHITAVIKAKPDTVQALTDIFKPLVEATRMEEGCKRYDLHQVMNEATTFIMMEEWQSQESIDKHNQSAHFQQFVADAKPLLAEPLQAYFTEQVL